MALSRRQLLKAIGATAAGVTAVELASAELVSQALAQVRTDTLADHALANIPGVTRVTLIQAVLPPGTRVTTPAGTTLFCWMVSGQAYLTLGGQTRRYGVGESFIVPKGAARIEGNDAREDNVQLVFSIAH
ncbi:MAG: hypothetical protein QN183_06335 [Armatimonadota bacterium]|nr:hypothetical protein [Armatimonadota bacterium]MDR7532034.1 hypothetical protein [Armatimonadota bacterium]MDR7535965.1 hypothetical protein [Armatimonadota bacterium]